MPPRELLRLKDLGFAVNCTNNGHCAALMTVECEKDDVCAVGQTVAAHGLCQNLAPPKHAHHLQPAVGRYGVFHGRRWQTETYPKVGAFIRAHD